MAVRPLAIQRSLEYELPGNLAGDLAASLLHRIDAWGVALIVSGVALWVHESIRVETVLLALAISATYGLGYAVNDYFDASADARDEAKARSNFFVRHPLGARSALMSLLVCAAALLSVFAAFGATGVALFTICLAVMWAYSAPPLRLKSRPGLDLLTHGLFIQTFAYFMCLVLIDATWTGLDYALLAVNFLASLSGQLSQQLRDFEIDTGTGRTFATAVGRGPTRTLLRTITLVLVLGFIAGLVASVIPLAFAPIGLAFVPAAIDRIRSRAAPDGRRFQVLCTATALLYATGLVTLRWFS